MQRASHRTSQKTGQRTTQRTTSTRKAVTNDAISLLTDDHKKVQKIFKDFAKSKSKGDDASRAEMVKTACQALTIHARVEEEIFYPALREVMKDPDLLDEAVVEHTSAKQLIADLENMQPGDELYDAKFTVLGEYINHHIKEEQKEIFPQAKKAKLDLVHLGEEIRHRKEELEGGAVGHEDFEESEEALGNPSNPY